MQPPANPALAAAVKLLSEKRYTKTGLAEKLRARSYAPDAIDAALLECERRRYLDDRTYAQLAVKNLLERKNVGRLRLLETLLKQGVDEALAAEVISETADGEDVRVDRALIKLETLRPHDGFAQVGRRLERLGFDAPVIARALRRRVAVRGAFPDASDFEEIG